LNTRLRAEKLDVENLNYQMEKLKDKIQSAERDLDTSRSESEDALNQSINIQKQHDQLKKETTRDYHKYKHLAKGKIKELQLQVSHRDREIKKLKSDLEKGDNARRSLMGKLLYLDDIKMKLERTKKNLKIAEESLQEKEKQAIASLDENESEVQGSLNESLGNSSFCIGLSPIASQKQGENFSPINNVFSKEVGDAGLMTPTDSRNRKRKRNPESDSQSKRSKSDNVSNPEIFLDDQKSDSNRAISSQLFRVPVKKEKILFRVPVKKEKIPALINLVQQVPNSLPQIESEKSPLQANLIDPKEKSKLNMPPLTPGRDGQQDIESSSEELPRYNLGDGFGKHY